MCIFVDGFHLFHLSVPGWGYYGTWLRHLFDQHSIAVHGLLVGPDGPSIGPVDAHHASRVRVRTRPLYTLLTLLSTPLLILTVPLALTDPILPGRRDP